MPATRHHRRRSYKLLAGVITLLVLVGIGGGADLGYHAVKTSADNLQAQLTVTLQGAQNELEAGKTSLTQANTKHDAALAAQASAHFAAAREQFKAAAQTADGSRLLRYLEQVPSVGQQVQAKHQAVDYVSDMGAQLSDAGLQLAALDQQLIKPSSSGPAGHTLLTVLAQTTKSLTAVRADLVQAQADAQRVPVDQLPSGQQATFLKARAAIDSGLAGLDEFSRLVPVLTEVLGGNGTRTYLVEQLNPAELRAGGGFIGSYSLLRITNGSFTVVRSGDSYDLANPRPAIGHPGFIPQPTPLRDIIPDTSWSFVDSNIYPDFPSNAKAAMQFVEPRVGKVDGVIAFDYYTVAKMLELTGPISIPGYGVTVNSNNFVPMIIRLDIAGTPNHKSMLGALAGPLMAKVSALPADRWPALIGDLNTMASERHLQAYLANAVSETEIDRVGWSGTLNPATAGEYFMEVEDNYYGDKVNYFLDRHYTIAFAQVGSSLHETITVSLRNRTAAGSYQRTNYKSVVRLYVSGGMSRGTDNLERTTYPDPAPPSGMSLLYGWIDVACCGGKGQAVFQYDIPWSPDAAGGEQVYWQKQPGTVGDPVDVVWTNGGGRVSKASGSFSQDTLISLAPNGVTFVPGHPAQATLPNLSLG